jgi:spore cortex formation protein SpoVR/YcgB (stage V sporulation)
MKQSIQDYARNIQFIASSMGIPRYTVQAAILDHEKLKQAFESNIPAYAFAMGIGETS